MRIDKVLLNKHDSGNKRHKQFKPQMYLLMAEICSGWCCLIAELSQ